MNEGVELAAACVGVGLLAACCAAASGLAAADPANATWKLTLEKAVEGKSLTVLLASRQGRWTAAISAPSRYNNAVHDVDVTELNLAAGRLSGSLGVTIRPDSWVPPGGKSIPCRFAIEAEAQAGTVTGTYRGKAGAAAVTGSVTGALEPPTAVPSSAMIRLRLEKALAGWPAHTARGLLDVAWSDGAACQATIRSAYGWGWAGRVESATLDLTDGSLGGEVRAMVGIRPGGTDLGGETYTFVLKGTIVGSAVVGHFEAKPAGKQPFGGTFTGTIEAGPLPLALPRPAGTQPSPKAIEVDVRSAKGPLVTPWKSFAPDPQYHGAWLVAGDLDGDGQAEIVTARNAGQAVTTVLANKLDGSVLWTWGKANDGGYGLGYDVPVQPWDLDGDGKDEVYLSIRNFILVLDGKSGKELRRLPLPRGLPVADCITFANLRGLDRPRDIIIKDRYQRLWAYTDDWKPLWHWAPRPRYTCHHPTLLDIDGDGKDEVLGGYSLLSPEGKELWKLNSPLSSFAREHVDSSAVLQRGSRPEDWRLALTYCTVLAVAVVDGAGRIIWEIPGSHFESVEVGRIRKDMPGNQMVVGIDKLPPGRSRLWMLDAAGRLFAEFMCHDSRIFRLIDWDGDGLADLLVCSDNKIFNGLGQCLVELGPEPSGGEPGRHLGGSLGIIADLDGDQRPEVILHFKDRIRIYKSDKTPETPGIPLGTRNFTLY